MKEILLGLIVAASLLSSCNGKKEMTTDQQGGTSALSSSAIEIVSFSKQHVVPGVESNLRGTQHYTLVLNTNFVDSTRFDFLLVDSVQIPITSIQVNGKRWRQVDWLIGENKQVKIQVVRHLYSKGGSVTKNDSPEVMYPLSGESIDQGEGSLVYTSNLTYSKVTTTFPLGAYVVEDRLIRP